MLYRLEKRSRENDEWAPASASVEQDALQTLEQALDLARLLHPDCEYRLSKIEEAASNESDSTQPSVVG